MSVTKPVIEGLPGSRARQSDYRDARNVVGSWSGVHFKASFVASSQSSIQSQVSDVVATLSKAFRRERGLVQPLPPKESPCGPVGQPAHWRDGNRVRSILIFKLWHAKVRRMSGTAFAVPHSRAAARVCSLWRQPQYSPRDGSTWADLDLWNDTQAAELEPMRPDCASGTEGIVKPPVGRG